MTEAEKKYDLWFKKHLNCNLISQDKYNSLTKFQAIDFAKHYRNEQVKKALTPIREIVAECPELNMGNYSDNQVKELNDAMIEIHNLIKKP